MLEPDPADNDDRCCLPPQEAVALAKGLRALLRCPNQAEASSVSRQPLASVLGTCAPVLELANRPDLQSGG